MLLQLQFRIQLRSCQLGEPQSFTFSEAQTRLKSARSHPEKGRPFPSPSSITCKDLRSRVERSTQWMCILCWEIHAAMGKDGTACINLKMQEVAWNYAQGNCRSTLFIWQCISRMDLCAISLSAFCSHSLVELAELLPTAALKIGTNTLPLRAIARRASVFYT